jgi:adenine-specific DNA-methyltransferase
MVNVNGGLTKAIMILNYIGSKVRVMPILDIVIKPLIEECFQKNNRQVIIGDLFAGTGVVGTHFAENSKVGKVISNDQELYSYIINKSLLQTTLSSKLKKCIAYLNSGYLKPFSGLITKNYSPYKKCTRLFFTVQNAQRIDSIRIAIHHLYSRGKISYYELLYLLASLFFSVSKFANNTSCFRAYLKSFCVRSKKPFKLFPIHTRNKTNCISKVCYGDVLLNASKFGQVDIVYLDPPYSSNHYGSYYGFYNYLATYQKKPISGIAGVPCNYNKSTFGIKVTAQHAFNRLIENILQINRAKYIVLSYNEDAVLSKMELIKIFKRYGRVICYKYWNRKFRPNNNVSDKFVKDFILVLDTEGIPGSTKECWIGSENN